jgi:hypothetical protein
VVRHPVLELPRADRRHHGRGHRQGRAGKLVWAGIGKTVLFIFLSPLLGYVLGSLMMVLVSWICRRTPPRKVDRWFRRLQLLSAGLYSLGHGGNDAQKTIGIIWMLLVAAGYVASDAAAPPSWVIWCCYFAIGMGTMFGGWRIVKTMGQRLTKLKPVGGFCAETGGAASLFIATALGVPVSTTHTITGAIVGVGSVRSTASVRWGWPATSSGPGSSPSRPRPSWRPCSTAEHLAVLSALGPLETRPPPAARPPIRSTSGRRRPRCPAARWPRPSAPRSPRAPCPSGWRRCLRRGGPPTGGGRQAGEDGLQRRRGQGQAQQRHQQPGQAVVQPQVAHAQHAIKPQQGGQRIQEGPGAAAPPSHQRCSPSDPANRVNHRAWVFERAGPWCDLETCRVAAYNRRFRSRLTIGFVGVSTGPNRVSLLCWPFGCQTLMCLQGPVVDLQNLRNDKMVVIRLARGGSKKRPFYNIVVADSRERRDGRFIERIGFYNPMAKEVKKACAWPWTA